MQWLSHIHHFGPGFGYCMAPLKLVSLTCFCYSRYISQLTAKILCVLSRIIFLGSKHPNNIFFSFENQIAFWGCKQLDRLRGSVVVVADTSVRSLQSYLFVTSKVIFIGSKHPENISFGFEIHITVPGCGP